MLIYKIDSNGYFSGTEEVPDDTVGIQLGTTRTAIPEIPDGMYAKWVGTGWELTDQPPPPVQVFIPEPEPVQEFVVVDRLELAKQLVEKLNLSEEETEELVKNIIIGA